jgi:hypothetical protein
MLRIAMCRPTCVLCCFVRNQGLSSEAAANSYAAIIWCQVFHGCELARALAAVPQAWRMKHTYLDTAFLIHSLARVEVSPRKLEARIGATNVPKQQCSLRH